MGRRDARRGARRAGSLAATEQLSGAQNERQQALSRQLQQLQYEARRAFEQYDQVDPANRLVSEVLERRWNEKLEALAVVQSELDQGQLEQPGLSSTQRERIFALGRDFERVWTNPSCPRKLQKQIVRTLVEEVIVRLNEATQVLTFVVHWRGGRHTQFSMAKPLSGAVIHKTDVDDIDLITKMSPCYDDEEIARVLSKLGRRTGKGDR